MPPPGRSSGTGPPGNSGGRGRDGGNPGGRPGGPPQSGQEPDGKPGRPGGRPGGGPDNNRPGPDGGGAQPQPDPIPPPPLGYDPIYIDGGIGVFEPDVKTGIVADQYAKLLGVPYREAFMPGGPESSIFSAKNVMPVETKADPRPYSKTKQIPIRDLINLPMRDATDAELLAVSGSPDEPMMSKDKYKTMAYELDYIKGIDPKSGGSIFKKPKKKPIGGGGPGVGKPNPVPFPIPPNIMPPFPGPITGPIVPLPIVGPGPITPRPGQPISIMPKPPSGGVFTPSPGGGGGGTYTGPGVNLPGPVIPLPSIGGPPKTGGNLIPLAGGSNSPFTSEDLQIQKDFMQDVRYLENNEGDRVDNYSFDRFNNAIDSEGNFLSPVYAEGGRVGKMDGGMMIIEDRLANDGIGSILNKYKEIRSKL